MTKQPFTRRDVEALVAGAMRAAEGAEIVVTLDETGRPVIRIHGRRDDGSPDVVVWR